MDLKWSSKMIKTMVLIAVMAIGLLLLSAAGCAQEIANPPEKPVSTPPQAPESAPTPASNLTYIIVDTGQHKCYDNFKEISCPLLGEPFYGQDARYQGLQPAYRDNGDGTVTDLNTGLIWQQKPVGKVTYGEAVAGADKLNLGGYNDWRLPDIKELYSLILFSGTDPRAEETVTHAIPFIDTKYFDFEYGDVTVGERIIDAQYWSSTPHVSTTMNGTATIFGVNFADGRIKGYPRDMGRLGQTATHFVLYVRGNADYGMNNFVDNGDGTITDIATGLMWSKADSGVGMDWEDALAWVQQKNAENYLGYNDWRLPNAKELQSIVDYTRSPEMTNSAAIAPEFNSTSIIDERREPDYPFYWTGTTHADEGGGGSAAVYVAFGDALGYMMNSWIDVHGAGAQRSDPKIGDPANYPHGRGPQGDAVRVNNFIRCVRDS
jgi:hypothetical protein